MRKLIRIYSSNVDQILSGLRQTVSSTTLGPPGMWRATTLLAVRCFPLWVTVGAGNTLNWTGDTTGISLSLDNCIRQEKGYCRIQWQQNAASTPDPFQLDTVVAAINAINALGGVYNAIAYPCVLAYVKIPEGTANTNVLLNGLAYQNEWCGSDLGNTVTPPITPSVSSAITCKPPVLRE